MVDRRYRTGTSSIDLPNTLRQDELRERIREAIIVEFSDTGEWLSQFDFGPWRLHLGSSASHYCGYPLLPNEIGARPWSKRR
jgi:hypothetical protein